VKKGLTGEEGDDNDGNGVDEEEDEVTENEAMETVEKRFGRYKAVVLQATELAVPFYEKMGFVRIGAVSR
jgi:hypothetical protein